MAYVKHGEGNQGRMLPMVTDARKPIECNPNFFGMTIVTLGATDHHGSFEGNTHRVIIRMETETDYFGWPDPSDSHNSPHWKPGVDQPLQYPKFAWEVRKGE